MTSYIKTQDAAAARETAKTTLKGIASTLEKSARQFVTLSIALADICADAEQITYELVREELKTLATTAGAETFPNDADAAKRMAAKLEKHSGTCVKTCLLLLKEEAGFFAGYRHADRQEFVSNETFNAMDTATKRTHHQELFWERDKTFPRDKNATGNSVNSSDEKVIPIEKQVLDAYGLHVGTRELNETRDGLKPTTKKTDAENQPSLSPDSNSKDVWKVIDNVINWLESNSIHAIDEMESKGEKDGHGATLARIAALEDACEKAIASNALAIRETEQAEKREADKKAIAAK